MPLTPRRDNPESRRFWEFVEQTAREVREQRPSWAQREESDQQGAAGEAPVKHICECGTTMVCPDIGCDENKGPGEAER